MLKSSKNILVLAISAFIISCSGAKNETAVTEEPAAEETTTASSLSDGTYSIDTASSMVKWEATKMTGSHDGSIDLSEGTIMVENGSITTGSFSIDLNTITALDLKDDPETAGKLEGHLKSGDFFNVELSPVSTFEITSVTEGGEGGATHTITGNLTIKNITNEISFPATVSTEGSTIKAIGSAVLDRTKWDMMFHSGLEQWGDKTIKDEFNVTFDITASKEQA
ncbi:YceI family protein [Chondrinema litorale]|uniref:YceI family protein n=1 Tax=Chondrinema litorale TaxID=2994555 RepID=UPI00254313E5|nr:YceI family protein [Chondrinema litorale]UZR93706.1 YceI family protein [Chondrinema litorale]